MIYTEFRSQRELNNLEFSGLINQLLAKGEVFVVETVVKVTGSSIGKPSFKEVISSNGDVVYGTLGGACPDSVIVEKAKEVMKSGQAKIVKVFLENTKDALDGLIANREDEIHVETFCGGVMEIFLEPFSARERIVIIAQGGRDDI
jgi:xanthine dehydrogenase accessory factor